MGLWSDPTAGRLEGIRIKKINGAEENGVLNRKSGEGRIGGTVVYNLMQRGSGVKEAYFQFAQKFGTKKIKS